MTEISQSPDGSIIYVAVTVDGVKMLGQTESMHGVACEAERLKGLIKNECIKAFDDPLA